MADKLTFDFGTGEIIFDTPGQKGMEIDPDFREKREAIMAAAGYGQTSMSNFRKEVNAMFRDLGFKEIICARSDAGDIVAAGLGDERKKNS